MTIANLLHIPAALLFGYTAIGAFVALTEIDRGDELEAQVMTRDEVLIVFAICLAALGLSLLGLFIGA